MFCTHNIHETCLKEYYKSMLLSNKLDQIRCLHCPPDRIQIDSTEQRTLILIYLGGEYLDRYNVKTNNLKVIKSKGRIFHCPKMDCHGLVNLGNFGLFQAKVACDTCYSAVCSSCQKLWHEGIKCTKDDDSNLKWEAIGDAGAGKVNRCPKCKAPFEKNGGCPHMKCSMCSYDWCWVCGLPFRSRFHKFSGIFCSFLAKISFDSRIKTCRLPLIMLFESLIFILWPLIFLGFCFFLFGYGLHESLDSCIYRKKDLCICCYRRNGY